MSYPSLPTSKLFQLTALTLSLALAGCGGGGTDTIAPEHGGGVQQPGNGGDNGGGETTEALNISTSSLVDVDGNPVNAIALAGAYYQVSVTDQNRQPVAGAKVSFDIDETGVSLTQSTSGSVLTGSDGQARVFLKPDSSSVSGAYTVSATVSFKDNIATSTTDFSVQATNVTLSALTVDTPQLSSGAQTPISLKVTNTNGDALNGVQVSLNASCGQIPAQISSDADGMIAVIYKSINSDNTLCSGPVTISANTGNSIKSATVTIQAPEATSIVYTSDPVTLGIANSGSSATGQIEFTVYSNRTPLANADVILSLEKSPLGLTFGVLGNKFNRTARTDENGNVSVNIYPGSTPGPVEIKAALARDTRINALSKGISIASSRVTQDGLSISQGKNVLDWSIDGDSTDITIRMVDRNGNSVPDGTVVNLTAEGGKVSPASCTTTDGVCSVTFSTQNPRPGDGRVSILAVAEGEKAYIDNNANNAWDEGIDTFVHNIGDTFRDDNENNLFETGEFTYPLTTQASGMCENNLDRFVQLKFPTYSQARKNVFKQTYIQNFVMPNKANTCNSGLDAVIRYETIQLLSNGSSARFTLVNTFGDMLSMQNNISKSLRKIYVRINSGGFYDLNPMPSGSIIAATINDKTDSPLSADCKVEELSGTSKVPALVNTGLPGEDLGTINGYNLDGCEVGDTFKISVTTPAGNTFSKLYDIV